jgi:phosphoglycolate phosphatase
MVKNIIFDWSGTLANDQDFTFHLTNETLTHFGAKPISKIEYQTNFKIPVDLFYSKYLPNISIEMIDNFFFETYKSQINQTQLFPKLKLFFEFAKQFNLNLYICSTLDQNILDLATKNLNISEYFKNIYGNCFNKTKSLPSIIESLQLKKEETIFIGDTPHDIEAGKVAKIQTGAILFGYTDPEIMQNLNPDEIFESTDDLYFKMTSNFAPNYFQKPIATVGGLIFDDNNNVLLIRTDKWSKKWGIPGGKIKYNEKMIDAFIREIKEETNLDIKDIQIICTQDCIQHPEFYLPRHFLLINYTAKAINLNVILNYESTEYKWVNLFEAKKLDLNQPTKFLIEKVMECKVQ